MLLILVAVVTPSILFPAMASPVSVSSSANKIIGVGLSQTGTWALRTALAQIGFANITLGDHTLVPYLFDEAQYRFHGRYDNVQAVLDLPTAFYFKHLMPIYPNAKYILTSRGRASEWYQRMQQHVEATAEQRRGVPTRIKRLYEAVFGSADVNKMDAWLAAYHAHIAEVRRTIPPHQLLELDVTDTRAWHKLCAFLQSPDGPCAPAVLRQQSIAFPPDTAIDEQQDTPASKWRPIRFVEPSKYAYVSLLANPSSAEQREYFMSFLVAVESIRRTGSTYDVVALIYGTIGRREELILERENIRYKRIGTVGLPLPSHVDIPKNISNTPDETALSIYRAKLGILKLLDYELVLFFDSDLVVLESVEHLFDEYASINMHFVGRSGPAAPINAGFMFLKPSWQSYIDIDDISATHGYNAVDGWLDAGPIPDWREGNAGKLTSWLHFYGGHIEQGLLYYYYMCFHRGNEALLLPFKSQTHLYTHFMGDYKPFGPKYKDVPVEKIPPFLKQGMQLWRDVNEAIQSRINAMHLDTL